MSEAAAERPAQWLAAARQRGDWRFDPARFHAMEALCRRLQEQPEAVRVLLEDKLHRAAADYAARLAAAAQERGTGRHTADAAPADPLRELNAYIRTRMEARRTPTLPGEARDERELPSARRFRQAWERGHSIAQVEQAVARRPAAAGPLNSHALLLQSLDLMRELSPDYLRRFLSHVETLQWLAQAREQHLPAEGRKGKPATPTRRKRKA
jgi:hypothetical protein